MSISTSVSDGVSSDTSVISPSKDAVTPAQVPGRIREDDLVEWFLPGHLPGGPQAMEGGR